MEIILKTDVENLGYKDQIVNVKPGYANNLLIPQGFATAATVSAKKAHAEMLRQRSHKEEKMVADATVISKKLSETTITITTKANQNGKIFGTVTTSDIAQAITSKGIDTDRRNIKISPIKEVGVHTAFVRVYKEVVAEVSVEVISTESVSAE